MQSFDRCIKGASREAQQRTDRNREGRSNNFWDRIFERYGSSTQQDSPNEKIYIRSFTTQNGTGTKGAMGKCSETVAANAGGEVNGIGSCQAHHVGISTEEDRGGAAGTVGEVQGAAITSEV
jgi:hypothetical protein